MRFYPWSGAMSQKLMADQPLHESATKMTHPVKNLLTRTKVIVNTVILHKCAVLRLAD